MLQVSTLIWVYYKYQCELERAGVDVVVHGRADSTRPPAWTTSAPLIEDATNTRLNVTMTSMGCKTYEKSSWRYSGRQKSAWVDGFFTQLGTPQIFRSSACSMRTARIETEWVWVGGINMRQIEWFGERATHGMDGHRQLSTDFSQNFVYFLR